MTECVLVGYLIHIIAEMRELRRVKANRVAVVPHNEVVEGGCVPCLLVNRKVVASLSKHYHLAYIEF